MVTQNENTAIANFMEIKGYLTLGMLLLIQKQHILFFTSGH